MHELSVCLSLLQQVEAVARQRAARSVEKIELEIGPLSGVEAPLLRNAYPLAAAGTIAEHAELLIDEGEIVVECGSCAKRSPAVANSLICGHCGDYRTRVVAGEEMTLRRVELLTD